MAKGTRSTQTTREVVAAMLGDGWTVREIAQRLDLSTQAVYYHRDQIARQTKLAAHSGTESGRVV